MLDRRPYAVAKEERHAHVTPVVGDVLFYVTVDRPSGTLPDHPAYGTAYGIAPYAGHKLCFVKQIDPEGQFFQYYYAADRANQDNYNFEFSQADLGGNQYDTVVRTYVILRSDFTDNDTEYQAGDAMPDVPASQFNDSYILMTRQQKRIGDQELDSLFVVEQRVYFRDEDKISVRVDPEFGDPLTTTERLAYVGKTEVFRKGGTTTWAAGSAAEESLWGVHTDGYGFEVEQLSTDWWKVSKQQLVPDSLTSGGSTYETTQNYSFPAELQGFRFTPIARKDGSSEISVTALKKDAFSGPIQVTVVRTWQATAPSGGYAPTYFKPTGGSYSGAQFNLSYSNVLTPPFSLVDTIGTSHPVYKLGAYAANFFEDGSTPQAQPASGATVNLGRSVRPFRGGFLVETSTGRIP